MVRAALGEEQRHQQAAGDRGAAERQRGAPVRLLRVLAQPRAGDDRERRDAQEDAGDRARPRAREREHRRGDPRAPRARPGGDGERDPERERHPADDDVAHHAAEEQPRRERRAAGRRRQPAGEQGEQPDRDDRGDDADQPRAQRARPAAGTGASSRPCGGRRTTGRSRSRSRPGSRARCGRCARPCPPSPGRRSGTRRRRRRRPAWGRADGRGHGARRPPGASGAVCALSAPSRAGRSEMTPVMGGEASGRSPRSPPRSRRRRWCPSGVRRRPCGIARRA